MPELRILIVGRVGALAQDLSAFGSIVHQTPSYRCLWAGLPSGTWDGCILDVQQLQEAGPDIIRHARELQPQLAVVLVGHQEEETRTLGLLTGADDILVSSRARLTARRVAHAVTFRRAKARGRTGPSHANVLVVDWDQVESPAVCNSLIRHDFRVSRAPDPWTALSMLRGSDFEILITPPLAVAEGTGIVGAALRYDPRLRVIVTSDVPDLADAATAMGEGAFDYLLRPVGTEQVVGAVQSAWAAFTNTAPSGEPTSGVLHVLVVENAPGHPRVLEQVLAQERRFAIVAVRDLEQAFRRVRERPFDAVLWNVDGPRSEVIRAVHELRRVPNQPACILISDRVDASLSDQAMRLGVQDIISRRHLGREALAARVRGAVQRNQYRLQQDRFVRDLQSREASQQEVVRRSVDAILIVDARGVVVFANPAAELMFSGAGTALLGASFQYPLEDPGPKEIEIRGGSVPCIADMTVGHIDWNGAAARLVSLRDVTERQQSRELRDRLAHTERLAAIGQLAAGVTHEINNPAAYVVANLTAMGESLSALLQTAADRPELVHRLHELSEMVQENLNGMARIRSITGDLRNFARIDSREVTLVDLNECVVAACKIAFNEIRQRAHLIQELGELPSIRGSQGKLAQVIMNLLVNAAQAIPEGNPDDHRVTVRTGAASGEVWVQVEDTGRGIPPDILARIFDPFFTTKPLGQGMGMGLALCADIVRQHQGTITALENSNGGALFELRFPMENELRPSSVASPAESQRRPRVLPGRPLRVLLIDDEPLVLRSLKRMLAPHSIDIATGGAEGLAKLSADSEYDLIFCDLMMPGMDGTAVYAEIAERFPELLDRLVFCSGGAFTPRTKAFVEQSARPIVEKPMTPDNFADIALRILGSTRHERLRGEDVELSTDTRYIPVTSETRPA